MKKIGILMAVVLCAVVLVPKAEVAAESYYNPYFYNVSYGSQQHSFASEEAYMQYLIQVIVMLQAQLQDRYDYNGRYYDTKTTVVSNPRSNNSGDDEPDVKTEDADDIEDDSAELNGEVDMNDYRNGRVFFVYGEDEDQIEDVEDDYDSYSDVDEDGDDLQKISVDSDLDDDEDYSKRVSGLDDDTDYYFQICVEYEDDDDDDTLECGGVEEFDTDDNGSSSNDDEPDVETEAATSIEDDSAKLRGDVDMNDFNNGLVFFVYGEDEDQIEDVEDDYDSYSDVDEDGDDLQKYKVDSDLDGSSTYSLTVNGLDDDTDYYFQICVEYEDDDDDDTLECGGVEDFETDD